MRFSVNIILSKGMIYSSLRKIILAASRAKSLKQETQRERNQRRGGEVSLARDSDLGPAVN